MGRLTEKELSALNDLLADEDLLTKKFKLLADLSNDPEIKDAFTKISEKHHGHFQALYAYLQ